MNCNDCKFWHQWEHQPNPGMTLGDCRHRSPILMAGNNKLLTKWPSTRAVEGCGDYRPHKPAK